MSEYRVSTIGKFLTITRLVQLATIQQPRQQAKKNRPKPGTLNSLGWIKTLSNHFEPPVFITSDSWICLRLFQDVGSLVAFGFGFF